MSFRPGFAVGIWLAASLGAAGATSPDVNEDVQLATAIPKKPILPGALGAAIRSGRVFATPHSLTLVLASGKRVTLRDPRCIPDTAENADCQHFELAADLPSRHFFLI